MLSDGGIKDAIKEENLIIEPFDELKLGSCSYDLTIEKLWHVAKPELDRDDYKIEKFVDICCGPYDGVLLPNNFYIGLSKETVESTLPFEVTTRSTPARCGIKVCKIPRDRNNTSKHLFFGINTMNTTCEIAEGESLAQLSVGRSLPVPRAVLENLIESEKFSRKLEIIPEGQVEPGFTSYSNMPYSILMHLGPAIRRYNGRPLVYNSNNDKCFDEFNINDVFYLTPGCFYLANTDEKIGMPNGYAGFLRRLPRDFGFGEIEPNSTLVNPGAAHYIVLEMKFPKGRVVKAGIPICRMDVYKLDQESKNPYNGRYKDQKGPQTNIPHAPRNFPQQIP